MNIDAINEAAEKILARHSKNYTKWIESEKPLFNLQLHGHEALAAIKEALQFKAEQKQTIVTDLPAPPYDDSVTHNLELKEI